MSGKKMNIVIKQKKIVLKKKVLYVFQISGFKPNDTEPFPGRYYSWLLSAI